MIDLKKLKALVKLMVDNELTELDLQGEDEKVTLKRGGHEAVPYAPAAPPPHAPPPAAAPAAGAPPAPESSAAEDEDLVDVDSPMVGTFYASPNPDADPFVQVGQEVDEETTVCIIEAMKVFNEIKAERSGRVEKMLVENGQSVEYGQPLFRLRPN